MNKNNARQVLLTYLLIILTVFTIITFTKNIYYSITENSWNIEATEIKKEEIKKEYDRLSKIKIDLTSGKIENMNFDKYLINFNEDEFLSYFYSYTRSNNWKVIINSISLSPGNLNDFWFKEWQIDLSVSFISEFEMLKMFDFLLNSTKYNFYVHNFSYPFNQINQRLDVNIPLKILYK